jgi:hypothetical protein
MKLILFALFAQAVVVFADIPVVPESVSPDGKIHAVMDIDRDPKMPPDTQGINFKQIEITEKDTGRILMSVAYTGATGDDERPLREHVELKWRSDSKAFGINIHDRFYSTSTVCVLNQQSKFVEVKFPSYKEMTGFPEPDRDKMRPRGRSTVEGWDSQGRLIYSIFRSPLPSYSGNDPLEHKVLLEATPAGLIPTKKTQAVQQ